MEEELAADNEVTLKHINICTKYRVVSGTAKVWNSGLGPNPDQRAKMVRKRS